MWVDEGGLIFYLVYEFERLRLLPGLDRSISNNCSSSNRTNNARAGFAPDELLGSGTTQPRPCIISSCSAPHFFVGLASILFRRKRGIWSRCFVGVGIDKGRKLWHIGLSRTVAT